MNLDRLKYRYWQHTDWYDTDSPLEAVYCNAVDGCDPTIAVSDFEFCTGLKDKNGNLIYEGDVVKQTQYNFDPAKRRVITGVIKWHPGHTQFVFEYPDGTGGHNICEIEWGINEIIGNIHTGIKGE